MVTYVGLMTFTDKGIQTVKDTTRRAAATREAAKKAGVNMREILWTMGEFDLVSIIEAEDEQAAVAILFSFFQSVTGNTAPRAQRYRTVDAADQSTNARG